MASQKRLDAFEALCRQHGLPVTVQRRAIYAYVCDQANHPTADRIYQGVQDAVPGMSRMTVYRVLDALIRIGALRKVASPGPTARFDANTARHHHLVCVHCDKLIDYEGAIHEDLSMPDARPQGFEIDDYSIQFRGVCAECRKKQGGARGRKRGSAIKRNPGKKR